MVEFSSQLFSHIQSSSDLLGVQGRILLQEICSGHLNPLEEDTQRNQIILDIFSAVSNYLLDLPDFRTVCYQALINKITGKEFIREFCNELQLSILENSELFEVTNALNISIENSERDIMLKRVIRRLQEKAESMYNLMVAGEPINVINQMISDFKNSSKNSERLLSELLIKSFLDKYKFIPSYKEELQKIVSVLFGSLIKLRLVTKLNLGIAFRSELDALCKPIDSKLFVFGTNALEQFLDRLVELPHYCTHILQMYHLRGTRLELVNYVEMALAWKKKRTPAALYTINLESSTLSFAGKDVTSITGQPRANDQRETNSSDNLVVQVEFSNNSTHSSSSSQPVLDVAAASSSSACVSQFQKELCEEGINPSEYMPAHHLEQVAAMRHDKAAGKRPIVSENTEPIISVGIDSTFMASARKRQHISTTRAVQELLENPFPLPVVRPQLSFSPASTVPTAGVASIADVPAPETGLNEAVPMLVDVSGFVFQLRDSKRKRSEIEEEGDPQANKVSRSMIVINTDEGVLILDQYGSMFPLKYNREADQFEEDDVFEDAKTTISEPADVALVSSLADDPLISEACPLPNVNDAHTTISEPADVASIDVLDIPPLSRVEPMQHASMENLSIQLEVPVSLAFDAGNVSHQAPNAVYTDATSVFTSISNEEVLPVIEQGVVLLVNGFGQVVPQQPPVLP